MSNNNFVAEAEKIAKFLERKSERTSFGLLWRTSDSNLPDLGLNCTIDLYNGTTGISLFFLETYYHTGNDKYLQIAEQSLDYILSNINEHNYYISSLYTDAPGVIYLLIRFYTITNDNRYLQLAMQMFDRSASQSIYSVLDESMILGAAGQLSFLLLCSSYINDERLNVLIIERLNQIISRANPTIAGVTWGLGAENIRPVCGFAHGNSGIAFTLLELGVGLKCNELIWLANQAYNYEDIQYQKYHYWPDYRKQFRSDEEHYNYLFSIYEDQNYFSKAPDMRSWCHGAVGIGLSRLRAYEITNKEEHLSVFQTAVDLMVNIVDNSGNSHIKNNLCHGSLGTVELLVTGYLITGDQKLRDNADVLMKAIISLESDDSKTSTSSVISRDTGLFLGYAGIGYTLLRLANPKKTPSIVMPRYTANYSAMKSVAEFVKQRNILQQTVTKVYMNSIAVINRLPINTTNWNSKDIDQFSTLDEVFNICFNIGTTNLTDQENEMLHDLRAYEQGVSSYNNEFCNFTYHAVEDQLHDRYVSYLQLNSRNNINNIVLKSNPILRTMLTKWLWIGDIKERWDHNKNIPPYRCRIVLIKNFRDTSVHEETELLSFILNLFMNGLTISEAIVSIIKNIQLNLHGHKSNAIALSIVLKMVRIKVLVPVEPKIFFT